MHLMIGMPVFEEKNIASVIKQQKIIKHVIVCDDGSSDFIADIANKMGAVLKKHPKNLGFCVAIRSVFLNAKELDADILVTFDADGQHIDEDINSFIEPIINDDTDIVIDSKFMYREYQKNIPKYRKFGIKTITSFATTFLDKKLADTQSGYRPYNKKVLQEIIPSEYVMSVLTKHLIKSSKKNFKIREMPITLLYEGDTSTHHPVSHGLSVILTTMKFISIEYSLKFYVIPELVFLGIGLFFIVWTIHAFTETRHIITNISLIGIGSIIIATVLMITAILLYTLLNVVRKQQ